MSNIPEYTASHIANFFLHSAASDKNLITQMKLYKLVYIAYGWTLAVLNQRLYTDHIEAWPHGPVIPKLYGEFQRFGRSPINELSAIVDIDTNKKSYPKILSSDSEIIFLLDTVWDVYKNFDAFDLRDKTHEEGTPWSITKEQEGLFSIISDNLIKEHFIEKITEYLNVAERPTQQKQ